MYKFVRNFKQKNSNNKSSDDASLSSSIKTTTITNNNVERSNLNDAAVITTTIINEPNNNNNNNKRSDITYTSLSTNSQVRKSFTIINNKNTQPKQSNKILFYLFLSILNLFFS